MIGASIVDGGPDLSDAQPVRRVLHIIRTVHQRQTGGPEEVLLAACPTLGCRANFAPTILLLRKPNGALDPAQEFEHRARARGIGVLPLQHLRWRRPWLRSLPQRLGIDVLHMHGQRANYFVWLMCHLYPDTWGRLPLIATVHGWVQDNVARRVVTQLELATLRNCDHIITVSHLQRQSLLGRGFPSERVTLIRNGVPFLTTGQRIATTEVRADARRRWGIPREAFVIAAVGRLSTEKRLDLYLDACATIASALPDALFLVVGGGKLEANLKTRAVALGLGNRVIFTGLTNDMGSIYASIDVLMLTSDTEGTPLVLLEALGSGIPVIATAVGGIPEIITSGTHGLLVPAGDREGLVREAVRLHDEPALRERLRAHGAVVAGRLTIERMVAGWEEVYGWALQSRHRDAAR